MACKSLSPDEVFDLIKTGTLDRSEFRDWVVNKEAEAYSEGLDDAMDMAEGLGAI